MEKELRIQWSVESLRLRLNVVYTSGPVKINVGLGNEQVTPGSDLGSLFLSLVDKCGTHVTIVTSVKRLPSTHQVTPKERITGLLCGVPYTPSV